MLNSIAGALYKIGSKVRKLRRELERSVSTAVSTGQTMTEAEVFRSREISAVTVGLDRIAANRLFSAHFHVICIAVTQKPKVQDQQVAR